MWINKTKEEIEKDNKKKISYIGAIGVFLGTIIVGVSMNKYGISRYTIHIKPLSWIEIWHLMPIFLFKATLYAAIIHVIQLLLKRDFFRSVSTTVVCTKCSTVKTDDGNYQCACGGTFVNIDKMKWVEDEPPTTE